MAAPTFVSYGASVFNTNATPKSVSPTVQVGDTIVIFGLTGNDLTQINTPSDGVNTYSSPQTIQVTDFVFGKVWTTTATTNATLTISATRAGTGGDHWGIGYIVHRNSAGIGTSNKANASGAPSVSLTTSANSAVFAFLGDWNAGATTGKTWRTVNGITPTAGNGAEKMATLDSGIYTTYAAVWSDTGSAGTNSYGMTAPTGQKYSIIAIEILASAGGTDVNVSDTPSGVRSGQSPATVAADVLTSDSPSGARLGQSPLLAVTADVTVVDTPSGARQGLSPASVVFDVAIGDTPSGTRLGTSPATVVLGVTVSDTPSGVRAGASLTGVTIDFGVSDTPGGVRLGQSTAAVILDTVVVDSPSGGRLGQSSAVVGAVVQVQDAPNGARLGSSSSVVSLAITDSPSGLRGGQSTVTVVADIFAADLPGGIRSGQSTATVTLVVGVGDTPSGIRSGQSPVQVTYDVRISDTPSGVRLGLSPATVNAGGIPTDVTVADHPYGVRSGQSYVVVTVSAPITDVPTIFATVGEGSIVAKARPFIFDSSVGVNVHAVVDETVVTAVVNHP
jgi:hypothetical protein